MPAIFSGGGLRRRLRVICPNSTLFGHLKCTFSRQKSASTIRASTIRAFEAYFFSLEKRSFYPGSYYSEMHKFYDFALCFA